MMRIILTADHRGYRLKERLKNKIKSDFKDLVVVDVVKERNPEDDYPLVVRKAVKKMKYDDRGVFICGSGVGVCIAGNRFSNIRAVNAHSAKEVKKAREDDDVNVLCLSGDNLSLAKAYKIFKVFIRTNFKTLKRYQRRVNQLKRM